MRISSIASAVPETVYSAEQIAAWVDADPEFVRGKVGVAQRAFLSETETGGSLAARAVEALFATTGIARDSIGLLIYVTQTPDHGIPHNSALLQKAAGLPTSLAAFDMGLGCSGYPYALTAAKGFMQAQGIARAMVVTCDPYSKIMRREDKGTVAVFGDAATATLIDADGTGEIGFGDFGTDGRGKDCLIVPAGRAARPVWSIHQDKPEIDADPDDYRLHMNGRNVFNFVMNEVPASLKRALERNRLTMEDITYFALHQGSLYMLQQLARNAGIPTEKLLTNLDRYGNTVSSTIPLLLEDQMALPNGLKGPVMISGFGVGLSWGSMVITFR